MESDENLLEKLSIGVDGIPEISLSNVPTTSSFSRNSNSNSNNIDGKSIVDDYEHFRAPHEVEGRSEEDNVAFTSSRPRRGIPLDESLYSDVAATGATADASAVADAATDAAVVIEADSGSSALPPLLH